MVKYCTALAGFALLLACDARAVRRDTNEPRASQPGSYRAMVYSESFGARFSLPKDGVTQLDSGLQAVVLRVVQRSGDHPDCFLDFYLDDTLELAFPEGSEGVMSRPDDEDPFFFVRNEALLGAQAHRWDAILGSYHAVACRKTPGSCLSQESGPYAYSRHLVPGVALQTYALVCNALDAASGPTEMWLLRAGRDPSQLQAVGGDSSATYRFAVPFVLLKHAESRVHQAMKYYEEHPLGPEAPRGRFTVPSRSTGERRR